MVSVPLLWMPPAKRALLPVSVTPWSISAPVLRIAPPLPPPALKLRIVMACSVSDPLAVTLKRRKLGAPLPRSRIAPLPMIVIGVVIDGRAMPLLAVVKVYVAFVRQIVSADAPLALAAVMALTRAAGFAAVAVQVIDGVGLGVGVMVNVGVNVGVAVGVKAGGSVGVGDGEGVAVGSFDTTLMITVKGTPASPCASAAEYGIALIV